MLSNLTSDPLSIQGLHTKKSLNSHNEDDEFHTTRYRNSFVLNAFFWISLLGEHPSNFQEIELEIVLFSMHSIESPCAENLLLTTWRSRHCSASPLWFCFRFDTLSVIEFVPAANEEEFQFNQHLVVCPFHLIYLLTVSYSSPRRNSSGGEERRKFRWCDLLSCWS